MTYRTKEAAIFTLLVTLIGGPLIILASLFGASHGHTQTGDLLGRVLFVILAIVLTVLGIRCAYSKVVTDATGVTVINPLSKRTYPWQSIERFDLGRWGLLPKNLVVHLVDGQRIGVWAVSARNPLIFPTDRNADGIVERLNDELTAHG